MSCPVSLAIEEMMLAFNAENEKNFNQINPGIPLPVMFRWDWRECWFTLNEMKVVFPQFSEAYIDRIFLSFLEESIHVPFSKRAGFVLCSDWDTITDRVKDFQSVISYAHTKLMAHFRSFLDSPSEESDFDEKCHISPKLVVEKDRRTATEGHRRDFEKLNRDSKSKQRVPRKNSRGSVRRGIVECF